MSWITDLGSVANGLAQYDLEKRKIASESNTTQPTSNVQAIDSKIEAQSVSGTASILDNKTLLIGGGFAGVVLLVLLLKR